MAFVIEMNSKCVLAGLRKITSWLAVKFRPIKVILAQSLNTTKLL